MPDHKDIVDVLCGLTPEEQVFVSAYSNCLNLTEAYLKVSPDVKRESAGHLGLQMSRRPRVRLAIQEYLEQRKASFDLDGKLIVHSLLQMAGADIGEFMDESGEISLAAVKAAAPELRRCVESVESNYNSKTGDSRYKVKMHDKLRAIELLGKYLKLWTDKMELGGEGGGPVKVVHEYVGEDVKPERE